eukprot:11218-Heterococcus_DN1.PRE.2
MPATAVTTSTTAEITAASASVAVTATTILVLHPNRLYASLLHRLQPRHYPVVHAVAKDLRRCEQHSAHISSRAFESIHEQLYLGPQIGLHIQVEHAGIAQSDVTHILYTGVQSYAQEPYLYCQQQQEQHQ